MIVRKRGREREGKPLTAIYDRPASFQLTAWSFRSLPLTLLLPRSDSYQWATSKLRPSKCVDADAFLQGAYSSSSSSSITHRGLAEVRSAHIWRWLMASLAPLSFLLVTFAMYFSARIIKSAAWRRMCWWWRGCWKLLLTPFVKCVSLQGYLQDLLDLPTTTTYHQPQVSLFLLIELFSGN